MIDELAKQLRAARLRRNESQEDFAIRAGITLSTYRRMEAADKTVGIGHWENAMQFMNWSEKILKAIKPEQSLLEKARQQTKEAENERKRAAKKESPGSPNKPQPLK